MPHGLLLTDDLFFATRVTGTARALGLRVDDVANLGEFVKAVDEEPPALVFVDLGTKNLAVADLVEALRVAALPDAALPDARRPRIVAFGSHVDVARLQEARDAGCDRVLPRSRFTVELPGILRDHLGSA